MALTLYLVAGTNGIGPVEGEDRPDSRHSYWDLQKIQDRASLDVEGFVPMVGGGS